MNAQVSALHVAGVNAMKAGRMEEAIRNLQLAAGIDPECYETYAYLGAAYARSNNVESARRAFGRAVQLKPDSAKARFNLGSAHQMAGNTDAARTCFEQALQLDPSYTAAQEALAKLPPKEVKMSELAGFGQMHLTGAQASDWGEEPKQEFVASSLTPEEIARLSMPEGGHLHMMGAQATEDDG